MADPFTPKFVDLVRNYTTTTGTGDFTLSAAVNGYTSIAAACQVGDRFYYSAIGVDKPAEREVGRGTLLANAVVKREPISGAKTNFTSGTKAIALIAAAEWFSNVQASAGQSPRVAATRAELAGLTQHQWPALLTEPGREGLFVWDASNVTAAVTADTAQGLYVAPVSDPTGASGAWVRKFEGGLRPEWFGAKGDNTTDDKVALQAWLDAGGDLIVPAKTYRSSARLIVRKLVRITGRGSNWTASKGSVIKFDAGVSGFDVQPDTALTDCAAVIAGGQDVHNQEGAFGSSFKDFALLGQGAGSAVGFYGRTYFHASNVNCWNFSGKGWDLSASGDAGDGNSEYGNMSNSALYDCGAYLCGSHALHIRGRDANTMTVENFSAFGCGGWGVLNESVIGNRFVGPNIAGNALGAIKIPGASSSLIVFPFIEGDGHENCEVNSNCVVSGTNLNPINNAPLTSIGVEPSLRRTKFIASFAPEVLPAGEYGIIYNWDGLSLAGRGSAKDVALYNKDGGLAAYVPTGTTHFSVAGSLIAGSVNVRSAAESTIFASRFQSGGINSYWPGVADGYMAMFANGTSGCTLGGYGTSYDSALTNRSGTVAAGVVANTTNFAVVGTVSGSNLNASGFPASVATGTIVGRSAAGTGAASALTTLPTAAMPALTGDVTTAGGSLATTIANNAVTYAKMQQVAATSLIGNPTGSVANAQGIALAADHSFSGTALQLGAFTGDISKSAGSLATTIANNAVSYAKMQDVTATQRLLGRNTAGAGDPEEITISQTLDWLSSTQGSVNYRGVSAWASLAPGSSGQFLKTQGAAANPVWADAVVGVTTANGVSASLASGSLTFTLGAITPSSVAASGAVTSSSATAGMGYAGGAGGVVTQATSKSTGVTLNKICGQITTSAAALAANTGVSFTITNSAIAATDTIDLVLQSGNATAGTYNYQVDKVSAGSFVIWFKNISGGSLSEALTFNFSIKKAVNA